MIDLETTSVANPVETAGETKLDELDLRIARELELDAQQSSRDIARRLGVAHSTVRRRVNRLIEAKVVRFVAMFNPKALGYNTWAKVSIRARHGLTKQVAQALADFPHCYFVAEALGRYDVVASVRFRNLDDLSRFVREDLALVDGIEATETELLVKPIKYYDFSWK